MKNRRDAKVEAAVIEIMDGLSLDEISELRAMARDLNARGVPALYGAWNPAQIVRAIVERVHGQRIRS